MSYKIAIDAGHGMNTAGKRCDRRYDPNETREWWLNNRIVVKVIEELKAYDVSVIRTDDPTGRTDVALTARTNAANRADVDVFVSVHHNAGGGSGIVVFRYPVVPADTRRLQDIVYEELIAATGNRGNRANPKTTADFAVLRQTRMHAVLCEMGFMDHPVDTPLILTEAYANACAQGLIGALVRFGQLKKLPAEDENGQTGEGTPPESEAPKPSEPVFPGTRYNGPSIVDALKSIGVASGFSYRQRIAQKNGIAGYRGTAAQNTMMLRMLKEGKLKRP
ncbi:MAG: N-acetylmuramoyl-L-alanine amidase [Christensenellales bacterium]|jgi:N-acetylmuramoyl-L-alanine amidase